MTETTYENLTRHIDRISAEMQEIGEKNGLSRLSLLANQTRTLKRNFENTHDGERLHTIALNSV